MTIDQRPSDLLSLSAPQPDANVDRLLPDLAQDHRGPRSWQRPLILVGTVAATVAITAGVLQLTPSHGQLAGNPGTSVPAATAGRTSTPVVASASADPSALPTWPMGTAVGNISARSSATPPAGAVYHYRSVLYNGGVFETWNKPDGTTYLYSVPGTAPGQSPPPSYLRPTASVIAAGSASHPPTFAELAAYPTDGKAMYARLHAAEAGRGRTESAIQGYVWKRLGAILMYADMAPQVNRRAFMAAAQLVPGSTSAVATASTGVPCLKVSRVEGSSRSWVCFDQATGSVVETGDGVVGETQDWVTVVTISEYVTEVPAQIVAIAKPS
jgi:hypothetical protein